MIQRFLRSPTNTPSASRRNFTAFQPSAVFPPSTEGFSVADRRVVANRVFIKPRTVANNMSFTDRYLTVWILSAMGLGFMMGRFIIPDPASYLAPLTVATTNIPIAMGLIVMITRHWRKSATQNCRKPSLTGAFSDFHCCSTGPWVRPVWTGVPADPGIAILYQDARKPGGEAGL